MEKLVYLLAREEADDMDAYREQLLSEVVPALRKLGAQQLTVNIADIDEEVRRDAPGRIVGPWETMGAVVQLWLDCLDKRAPLETLLEKHFAAVSAYLVTESVPQACEQSWADGERRPGVTQFTAHAKPGDVSEEDFYYNWQVLHSKLSFDLHPLRWSYVRDAVARKLSPAAPDYRALVMEHFRELRDFTDENRYFGAPEVVERMYAELPGFCDFSNMVTGPMSEYRFG